MRNRTLFVIVVVGLLVLIGCAVNRGGLSGMTPTPTKTPRPLFTVTLTPTSTSVSEATATDTPVPTDTPAPPTETLVPTDTPIPWTDTPMPTETLVPPTDTPIPPTNAPALPTDTPRPRPTNTPVPPTNTPKPQVDFRIQEIVAFEDGSLTKSGFHNIYFTVMDAGGAPMDGIIIEEVNNQPATQVISGDKGPGKAEFTMYAADYRFKVVGNNSGQAFSSEVTHVLSIVFEHAVWDDLIRGGICADEASCRALGPLHFSYNVTFQRTW